MCHANPSQISDPRPHWTELWNLLGPATPPLPPPPLFPPSETQAKCRVILNFKKRLYFSGMCVTVFNQRSEDSSVDLISPSALRDFAKISSD